MPLTQRERFRNFVAGTSCERSLPFPMCKTAFVASGLGRQWATEVTHEEIRDFLLEMNCIPAVILGEKEWFPHDHPLSLFPRLQEQSAEQRDYRACAQTPFGELTLRLAEFKRQSLTLVKGPVEQPEDFKKVLWYLREVRQHTDAIRQRVREVRQGIGEDCLLVFFLPQPYELYCIFNREEALFLEMDHPKIFAELQAEILATVKSLIKPAIESGADLLFFGSAGTELYSPEIFRAHLLQPSIEYARLTREAGGISTFHLCGRGKEYLDMNVFGQIRPDIVEGVGTSTTGNIPSLDYAWQRLPASTLLRGNVPLGLLRDGSPEAVYAACQAILQSQPQRRHILSGECDILYGTPPQNIRALVAATR